MDPHQGTRDQPAGSSTTSTTTTTTHGPHGTTTVHSTIDGHGTTSVHDFGPNTHTTTINHPTVTTTTHAPALQVPAQAAAPSQSPSSRLRSSSIRIRRPSAQNAVPSQSPPAPKAATDDSWQAGRRRSSSEPRPPSSALFPDELDLRRQMTGTPLQAIDEQGRAGNADLLAPGTGAPPSRGPSARRQPMQRQLSAINIRRNNHNNVVNQRMMDGNVVDVLDVIDPEISALTTLNNVQNSLFLPNLPWLYNRQPTYDLAQSTSESSDEETAVTGREDQLPQMTQAGEVERAAGGTGLRRTNTIDSILSTMEEGPEHHYAVLPHGASLPGWTDEEKAALDDHVRHVLHSKRARFKRTMRGFGRYVRNPLGFIVTLYFFLITFWGAAWVLFLIGWISVKGRQEYFVEICDQILTALFCVVGITMFPFRIVDTYHMIFVALYAHRTWRLRKERGLAELKDHNELPRQSIAIDRGETTEEEEEEEELPVLTEEEQQKLEYHQAKIAKSHTFYRPTETYTHNAFSIRLLITIIVLLDCHSMFQCALGGTTWGIYYKVRPKALTAVILSCSLTCNITAGIIIGQGDKRSRKKLVVEQLLRQEITEEALKKLRKERGLKARGLMTKGQKKNVQKEMGEKKKSPLDTILHRG
ncbi:hypothetical protein BKA63DRAFT_412230 [Paraphoma chrysanthemicola]|nr:hypothetical protein BKA63DRAFT_412230 [Paraphoma chrysanthemicola]